MAITLSIVALLISIFSAWWSVITHNRQRQCDAIANNTDVIVDIEGRIAEIPSLLRFHGIEDPEAALMQHEITSAELAYLVNSFTVGGTFYRTAAHPHDILKVGSYRRKMCQALSTRKAWPLVRIMLADTPYRAELDSIFALANKSHPITLTEKQEIDLCNSEPPLVNLQLSK